MIATPPPDAGPAAASATPPAAAPADPGGDPLPAVPVVVLGLMAAGKTTVARELARRWDRPLRDSDADLEERTGRTAAEVEDEQGAGRLHQLEAEILLDALAAPAERAPVVAAAASTVDREDCRRALREQAVTVWLDADPDELADRAQEGDHRPDTGGDLEASLRAMDARRRPLFAQTAHVVVPVGDDQEELVRRVAAQVAVHARSTRGGRSR